MKIQTWPIDEIDAKTPENALALVHSYYESKNINAELTIQDAPMGIMPTPIAPDFEVIVNQRCKWIVTAKF